VLPDLAPEPEDEASVRRALQVPRNLRRDHRRARKRDRDAGRQLEPLRVLGGDEEREEGIAVDFRRHDAVEAERFDAPDGIGNAGEVVVGEAGLDRDGARHARGLAQGGTPHARPGR
jgi:hypothetical protein